MHELKPILRNKVRPIEQFTRTSDCHSFIDNLVLVREFYPRKMIALKTLKIEYQQQFEPMELIKIGQRNGGSCDGKKPGVQDLDGSRTTRDFLAPSGALIAIPTYY